LNSSAAISGLTAQAVIVLLAAVRLVPILAFSPPFTLVKMPAATRAATVIAIAAFLASIAAPAQAQPPRDIPAAMAGELAMGISLALALQFAFAMIGMAARALDIQAGFGLAFVIDPTTKAQMPLIGALFGYAAAAVFFATGAPFDLLSILALSFERVPPGLGQGPHDLTALLAFTGTVLVMAMGLVGLAITVLFLIDLSIAALSRTLPQMNVLVLGFQVKALVTLLILPMTTAVTGAMLVRIIRVSLEAMMRIA
jgi:flagellar biosynthetic protein FliR